MSDSDLSHGTSRGAIVQLQRQDAALLASRLCSGRRYGQRDATVAADAICVCVVFLRRTESPKIPKQSTTLLMSSKSRERRALPLFMCLENPRGRPANNLLVCSKILNGSVGRRTREENALINSSIIDRPSPASHKGREST